MSTHEQKHSHVRQQAARDRVAALYPGLAALYARRDRAPASTPDLPTDTWFGNLAPQLYIPQSAGPATAQAAQHLADMASAHAAQVSALTAHVSAMAAEAHAHAAAAAAAVANPQPADQLQAPLWQQLLPVPQQPLPPQPNQVVPLAAPPSQLAASLLQQQQTQRLRKYGWDLAAAAAAGQNIKKSEALEAYEKKIDAMRKSMTPAKLHKMTRDSMKVKGAKVEKGKAKKTTEPRVRTKEEKAKALKAWNELSPERQQRAWKRATEKLKKEAEEKRKQEEKEKKGEEEEEKEEEEGEKE